MGVNDIRITPPGPVEHDEDGDPVPQPVAASDLADLIQLMEWARTKGYRVGPMVRVGKLALQISDVRQREGKDRKEEEPDRGIFAEHGYSEEEP